MGIVSVQGDESAISELRRCMQDFGFKPVMMRPVRYRGTKKLNHPDYDTFWAAAADMSPDRCRHHTATCRTGAASWDWPTGLPTEPKILPFARA